MYLKIRQQCKADKDESERWYIIGDVSEVIWSWVKFTGSPHKVHDSSRVILSNDEKDLEWVRNITIWKGKENNTDRYCEEIYCDNDVYLCNDNGQTIEKL